MSTLNNPSGHIYCLALQPICDLHLRHVADELLYRSSINSVSAVIHDPIEATARVCNVAFYEAGIQALCGNRKLFFNAPRDWLLNPDLLPPDTDQVVIEVLEEVEGDQEVMDALHQIKALGYKLALDDFVLNEKTRPLLDLADIIKLDILHGLPEPEDLQIYKEKGLTLLAERVEDHDIFEQCKALGFTLFQGYFYAKPVIDNTTAIKRGGNHGAQLQLLGELQKTDIDFDVLENFLAQDPQLCIRLLKMINSPRYRRVNTITSIRQALMLLGVKRLKTLVMTLVLANDDPMNMLLLPETLTRAAMCEHLARDYKEDPDSAFMAGLLSMASIMLNEPLESLCQQLPLSLSVKSALLEQEGQLGKILKLVMAFEQARLNRVNHQGVAKLNRCYLESRVWASELLTGISDDI